MTLAQDIRSTIVVQAPDELVDATAEALAAFAGADEQQIRRLLLAVAPAWVGPHFVIMRHFSHDHRTSRVVPPWARKQQSLGAFSYVTNTIALYPVGAEPGSEIRGGVFVAKSAAGKRVVLYDVAREQFTVDDPFLWRQQFASDFDEDLPDVLRLEYFGQRAERGPGRR